MGYLIMYLTVAVVVWLWRKDDDKEAWKFAALWFPLGAYELYLYGKKYLANKQKHKKHGSCECVNKDESTKRKGNIKWD